MSGRSNNATNNRNEAERDNAEHARRTSWDLDQFDEPEDDGQAAIQSERDDPYPRYLFPRQNA